MLKQIPDGNYELADGAAWLVVKNFSIRIRETENGVSIGVYKNGRECDGPVQSAHVLDSEVNEQTVKENQMKEHPHAWALRLIADGVPISEFEVQAKDWNPEDWSVAEGRTQWFYLPERWLSETPEKWQVRKQKTIIVNGCQVPEPCKEMPESGNLYAPSAITDGFFAYVGEGEQPTILATNALKRGVLHTTPEAAAAHAKALLAVEPNKP